MVDQKEKSSDDIIVDDGLPWYAVRLFTLRLKEVKAYFEALGYECFVPMQYVDIEKPEGGVKHEFRPVIHNIVFVKQTMDESVFKNAVLSANFKINVIRQMDDVTQFALIPSKQMYEFRLMCNPKITLRKFLSESEAQMKIGNMVLVKYGPLKGMTGRLVRTNKKYYLLKEIPGIGVMLKVSRWCCVPTEEHS